jgi:hypothetical protein
MEGQGSQEQHIDNAVRKMQEKKQIPEIDFTLHTMEDGTQVSTQERVCKGKFQWTRKSAMMAVAPSLVRDTALQVRDSQRPGY